MCYKIIIAGPLYATDHSKYSLARVLRKWRNGSVSEISRFSSVFGVISSALHGRTMRARYYSQCQYPVHTINPSCRTAWTTQAGCKGFGYQWNLSSSPSASSAVLSTTFFRQRLARLTTPPFLIPYSTSEIFLPVYISFSCHRFQSVRY
jgi:hypothetical protein